MRHSLEKLLSFNSIRDDKVNITLVFLLNFNTFEFLRGSQILSNSVMGLVLRFVFNSVTRSYYVTYARVYYADIFNFEMTLFLYYSKVIFSQYLKAASKVCMNRTIRSQYTVAGDKYPIQY